MIYRGAAIVLVTLAVVYGVYQIGYYDAYQTMGAVHPSARGPLWYEWLGSIAGAAAVIVAVSLAAINWTREHREKRAKQNAIAKAVIVELETIANEALAYREDAELRAAQDMVPIPPKIYPTRLVFDALGDSLANLPPTILKAVCKYEGSYRMRHEEFMRYQSQIRSANDLVIAGSCAGLLSTLCTAYVYEMKGISSPVSISTLPPPTKSIDFGPPYRIQP